MSDTPGALEHGFTPDVEEVHASAPGRRRRIEGLTRGQWVGAAIAAVMVVWLVWAFCVDGTVVVALFGAGVAQGAIVALAAVGFLTIQKATGIANFAQGDLITLGAFLAFWATDATGIAKDGLGLSLGLGILVTLVLMFGIGVGIERVAYAPLRGRDIHVVVIATLGIALVIRTLIGIWQGSSPRSLRSWFSLGESLENFLFFRDGALHLTIGFLGIDDAVISAQRVVIIVVTAVVVLGIMLLFSRTSFGRQVRAIAADRETARLYGVRANSMSMLAFGISAALAGLAGILIGPLSSFDLTLGFSYMLLGFAAAVLGGFGSIGGVVVGALMIGLTDQLFGGAMLPLFVQKVLHGDPSIVLKYRSLFPYLLMLIVIAVRPQGIFGRAGKRL